MASLGENSLGSLPIPEITALQTHLLQDDQLSADAQAPRPHADTTKHDESSPSPSRSRPAHDKISESIDALPSHRAAQLPPRLTPSRSAPAGIDAMVQHNASQGATIMTRPFSFHGYAGGDTQPMGSQVYRDYTESMTKSSGTTPKKTVLRLDEQTMDDKSTKGDTSANDRTQHTMAKGEEGYVDLDIAFQGEDSPTAKSATSGYEELLAGPETQSQNNNGTNGSFVPRTPGVASDKRRRSGDIPTSATDASRKTPGGFSQMFGMAAKMPAFSATQLFDQTQAQSSPMLDIAHSDPIVDRPSPNMNTNGDLSPDAASSSPMLMMRNPPASTAGEPRDTYTSMRESQERRAARLRQDLHLENRFGPGAIAGIADEDEDDTQQIRMERQRLKRVLSDQAMEEWNKYRAPSRPGHRSVSARKTTTIDLVTPGTLRKQGRVQFDLSEDEQETEDEDMDIELPVEAEDNHDGEGVADVDGAEDANDDDDIYDEYGQTVLRSQRDPDDEDGNVPGSDDENAMRDEDLSDQDGYDGRDDAEEDVQTRESRAHGEHIAGTQPAVADSQPERLEAQRSLLPKEPSGQPATSSIIPGSQYVGATSQELARHSNQVPNSSIVPQQHGHDFNKSQHENRVPSSPPVPAISHTEQKNDSSNSTTRPQRPLRSQPEYSSQADLNRGKREIPESDQPEPGNVEAAQEETIFETAAESNAPAPFLTAQTHLNESERTPKKPRPVKEMSKVSASQQSMPTPLRAAGVRRFADIAADPSPPELSGESQLDMDAIIGNVISMDDQNFMDVLSSPPSEKPTKRRRLMTSESSRRRSRLPSMEVAGSEAATESVREPSSPGKAATTKSTEPAQAGDDNTPVNTVKALRSSPTKANQIPTSTPEEVNAPDTPESVRRREEAGSKAASRLLSARPLSGRVGKPARQDRKSSAARQSKSRSVSRRDSSKLKHVVEKTTRENTPQDMIVPQEDESEQIAQTEEQVPQVSTAAQSTQALHIDAPERVLALFRGATYNAFYPATWLSRSTDGKGHVVRFDDTTVATLDGKAVHPLLFRIGDAIKIDYEGYRSKTWLVKSFGRKAMNEDDRANGVDIYGHVTLHVQAKVTQRNSTPAQGIVAQSEGEVHEIMVTNVKITHTMISPFAKRKFDPQDVNANSASRRATPSVKEQSPGDESPSRTRRATASAPKSTAKEPSKLREESVASSTEVTGAGMFEGMAFAISYASNETEKFDVTNLIRRNGGLILEQGFDELFIAPQLDEQTTPTKRSGKPGAAAQSGVDSGSLRLKPEFESLGFIALIADKHSRRAKYMQALALEIPTLSGRWVIDSFDSSRNEALPSSPRPWTRYLLPAGESSYLGGAVRSRTLQYYNPSSVKLPVTVNSRALLLGGAGVLLVAPKKGKGTWERRKAYAFLTLALGAGSVRRVADLAEAKKLLASDAEKQNWAWVYVDDDVNDAAKLLFGTKGSGAGRKRKRNEGPQMCVEGMHGRVKVVGDEFVIQSLILGALVD